MLGAFEDRNEGLWLCSLRCLINKHLSESEVSDATVKGSDTSCANYVSITEDLIFCLPLKVLKVLFILLVQLALFFFPQHQFLHTSKVAFLEVLDLFMKTQIVDIGANGLAGSRTKPHDFQSCPIDLVCKLVHGDV